MNTHHLDLLMTYVRTKEIRKRSLFSGVGGQRTRLVGCPQYAKHYDIFGLYMKPRRWPSMLPILRMKKQRLGAPKELLDQNRNSDSFFQADLGSAKSPCLMQGALAHGSAL